jgi:tRNA(Ile)-lysidine synthase
MLERVLKSISRYNMLPSQDTRVIAAVSGGPDSVCLLHVLRELGVNVVGVAHFNHKLRAEASDEDERFVATLASQFDLAFHRSAAPLDTTGNLEQNARQARRQFFATLIRENGCDCIALGHTRDDQAETVLFRVLRGSGLAGLSGIHPATADGFIRPLIDVTRAEVEDYLRTREIPWREDASNRDPRFARNRIRHELLPQLAREWNPQIGDSLAQLADLALEEERYWRGEIAVKLRQVCGENHGGMEIDRQKLDALPRAVARRIIRQVIASVKGDLRRIEFHHVEGILNGEDPGVPGIRVLGSFRITRIESVVHDGPGGDRRASLDPVNVEIPGTYTTFEGTIRLQIGESPGVACANLKAELVPVLRAPMVLRSWKPGDHYRPAGKSRDRKLKEMFQQARIPSWRRPGWPILESEGKIVWAREFGAAEEFCAAGQSGPVLQIWDE